MYLSTTAEGGWKGGCGDYYDSITMVAELKKHVKHELYSVLERSLTTPNVNGVNKIDPLRQ